MHKGNGQQEEKGTYGYPVPYSKSPRFHHLFILRSPSQQFYTRFAVRKSRKPRHSHPRSLPQTRHIRFGGQNKHKSVGFTAGNAGQTRHLVTPHQRSLPQSALVRFAVQESRKPRLSHLRSLPHTRHIRFAVRKSWKPRHSHLRSLPQTRHIRFAGQNKHKSVGLKQAQTSRLHCRERKADSTPGYPTSAKLTKERPRALRCPEIPETTPFTSAKPTTDPSHPLRWTKQAQASWLRWTKKAQTSRLHCRKRRADSAPGYPTKRVGASVRQKNGGFYDGRYRNPHINFEPFSEPSDRFSGILMMDGECYVWSF